VARDPGYSTDPKDSIGALVEYSSEGGNIFVVSDLHLAAGKAADGRYDGCENFFYDESFHRFLQHAHDSSPSSRKQARRALVLIRRKPTVRPRER